MIRTAVVFLVALILGLFVQATWVHYLAPSAIAPDFILILVVYIGLRHRNMWGALAAFALGIAGDLASARYIGPHAAGCVSAFFFVTVSSSHMFAEKDVVTGFLTFLASLVKSTVFVLMIHFYLSVPLSLRDGWIIGMEAFITAIITPIVLRLLRPARSTSFMRRLEGELYH